MEDFEKMTREHRNEVKLNTTTRVNEEMTRRNRVSRLPKPRDVSNSKNNLTVYNGVKVLAGAAVVVSIALGGTIMVIDAWINEMDRQAEQSTSYAQEMQASRFEKGVLTEEQQAQMDAVNELIENQEKNKTGM